MLSTAPSSTSFNLRIAPMADKEQPKRGRSPLTRKEQQQQQRDKDSVPSTPRHGSLSNSMNPSPRISPEIPSSTLDLDHPLFSSPESIRNPTTPPRNGNGNSNGNGDGIDDGGDNTPKENKANALRYDSDNTSLSSSADSDSGNYDHVNSTNGANRHLADVSTSTLALYHQYQVNLVSDPLDSPTSFFSMSSNSTIRQSTDRERPRSMEVQGTFYNSQNQDDDGADAPPSPTSVATHRSSPRRRVRKPVPISVPRPYLHPQAPNSTQNLEDTLTATEFESKFLAFQAEQLMTDAFGVPLSPTTHQLRDIYILVVGAKNSGKTTFIKKCHGLGDDDMPASGISSRMVIIDDLLWHVRLVETSSSMLPGGESYLTWPQSNAGQRIPYVDGVLILCDVTNKKSVDNIPNFIDCASREKIPTLLVSCKWDLKDDRELDEDTIQDLALSSNVVAMQSSASSEGHKSCYSTMLYLAVQRKTEKRQKIQLAGRRRAKSSAANSVHGAEGIGSTPGRYGHHRSSSEWSSAFKRFTQEHHHHHHHHHNQQKKQQEQQQKTGSNVEPAEPRRSMKPRQVINAQLKHQPGTEDSSRTYSQDFNPVFASRPIYQVSSTPNTPPIEVVTTSPFCRVTRHVRSKSTSCTTERRRPKSMDRRNTSFVKKEESEGLPPTEPVPVLPTRETTEETPENQNKYIGVTWDELIERLLAPPRSKSDKNFRAVFICYYRRFAAPRDLLDAILKKFEELNTEQKSELLRKNDQLRYCMVLFEWVSNYPGDFAHPTTQKIFRNFISSLSSDRTLAGMARDMSNALLRCTRDEDASWGRVDQDDNRLSVHSFVSINSVETIPSSSSNVSLKDSLDQPNSSPSSSPNISSVGLSAQSSLNDCIFRTIDLTPGSKEQYEAFMEIPDEDIARELTRVDWELFSKIKPRDFIRHVSFSAEAKEKEESLQHINSLISHFNRIAYWVAKIVLLRSKPRHRARALEKFMNIAWLLRHDNNYNSLGALIAGINGIAVHRLTLTRSLVDEKVQRHFMSLEMLMGTHKSHFAYRLAWENTHGPRIPFIPLHRRDLVSAEQGNRTLRDGIINWRKFEVMGEILVLIMQSQNTPYTNLTTNPATEKLVRDALVSLSDEELMLGSQELYERSVQLESIAAQQEGLKSAKRNWFKR